MDVDKSMLAMNFMMTTSIFKIFDVQNRFHFSLGLFAKYLL